MSSPFITSSFTSFLPSHRFFSSHVPSTVTQPFVAPIPTVTVLQIRSIKPGTSGAADLLKFLQNLTTQDIFTSVKNMYHHFHPTQPHSNTLSSATYTAFLNGKGRMLFDAIIAPTNQQATEVLFHSLSENNNQPTEVTASLSQVHASLLLHVSSAHAAGIQAHLAMYNLRKKVTVEDVTTQQNMSVYAVVDTQRIPTSSGTQFTSFVDPRTPLIGSRTYQTKEQSQSSQELPVGKLEHYDLLRIYLGLVDMGLSSFSTSSITENDITPERSLPLECNVHWANGVSFKKGCYLGQELTARTHFQGLIRKRIYPCIMLPTQTNTQEAVVHKLQQALSTLTQPANQEQITQAILAVFNTQSLTIEQLDVLLSIPSVASHTSINLSNAAPDSEPASHILSVRGPLCLAMLREEHVYDKNTSFIVKNQNGETLRLVPYIPHWWKLEPKAQQS